MITAGSLAALLREWRVRALLTQEQLADISGLGVRTIRRLEAGEVTLPRSDSLRRIADALDLQETERAQLVVSPPTAQQLPARLPGFTGRARELMQLDNALASGSTAVIAIVGTAGVGKTSLAVQWAHRVADRFPDGQLYADLRGFSTIGAMTVFEALRGFVDTLTGGSQRFPAEFDAQVGLWRSLLAGKRMLVVLDNAREAEQVRPLLPGAAGCVAVVTSRNELTGLVATEAAHQLRLGLMSKIESRQLLAHRIGRDRMAEAPQAVDEIIRRCARLPLALAVVAAHATSQPHRPLHVLASQIGVLQQLGPDVLAGDDPATDVRTVLSWSYQRLSPASALLFRLLGLQPAPDISALAVASLAGGELATVLPLLAELLCHNMIAEPSPGRFAFHDLLRAFATELARCNMTDAEANEAQGRLLDHYLHGAEIAEARLGGVGLDRDAGRQWFAAERLALLTAVELAATGGFDLHAGRLARAMSGFFNSNGHWHELAAVHQAALVSAERLADPAARAHSHAGLAEVYTRMGQHHDGYLHAQRAAALFAEYGDHHREADLHRQLCWSLSLKEDNLQALHHAQQALKLYRICGSRAGEANAINAIAWCRAQLGDYRQTVINSYQALCTLQEIGDRAGEATALHSLGLAHHHLANHQTAILFYRRALALRQDIGDQYTEAGTLMHLGDVYATAGDRTRARNTWQTALRLLKQLSHPKAGEARQKLANLRDPHM